MTKFEKKIAARLQGFVDALERDEEFSETFNCRTIVLDLQPTEYKPSRVVKIRKQLGASQPVFAQFLGVSVKTIRAWEQGVNPPNDMACRFLDEINRNIAYWKKRLKDSVKVRTAKAS